MNYFFLGLSLLLKESGSLILEEEPASSAETGVFAGAKTLAAAHVQALGGANKIILGFCGILFTF